MKHSTAAAVFASILISAGLLLTDADIVGSLATRISAASSDKALKSELSALEDKLAQASAARKQAEAAVKAAKTERADALTEKKAIDAKILALSGEIEVMQELVIGLEAQIEAKNVEIATEQAYVAEVYDTIKHRLRSMREDGNADVLRILLDADGLTEFFTVLDRFTCMLDYDDRLLKSYNSSITLLSAARDELDLQKSDYSSQLEELEARRLELEEDLKKAQKLVADAERDVASANAALSKVEETERKTNAEREEKLADLQKSSNNTYVGGEFLWPLPVKYTTVTSGFGYRIHPVTGRQQFHNGIDIPAPYGTEIYAVNDGQVIEVSYNYADGYYVTVSHGGGVASFYSHISKSRVKVGDKVKRGQVIANVGTSGYTTGAHLNLNVYENNTAVNPMKYFK